MHRKRAEPAFNEITSTLSFPTQIDVRVCLALWRIIVTKVLLQQRSTLKGLNSLVIRFRMVVHGGAVSVGETWWSLLAPAVIRLSTAFHRSHLNVAVVREIRSGTVGGVETPIWSSYCVLVWSWDLGDLV